MSTTIDTPKRASSLPEGCESAWVKSMPVVHAPIAAAISTELGLVEAARYNTMGVTHPNNATDARRRRAAAMVDTAAEANSAVVMTMPTRRIRYVPLTPLSISDGRPTTAQ